MVCDEEALVASSPLSKERTMSDIRSSDEALPEQTDNRPRPEDGEQPADELQKPGSERTDFI